MNDLYIVLSQRSVFGMCGDSEMRLMGVRWRRHF